MEDPVLIFAQWLGTPEAALLAARPALQSRADGGMRKTGVPLHPCVSMSPQQLPLPRVGCEKQWFMEESLLCLFSPRSKLSSLSVNISHQGPICI